MNGHLYRFKIIRELKLCAGVETLKHLFSSCAVVNPLELLTLMLLTFLQNVLFNLF